MTRRKSIYSAKTNGELDPNKVAKAVNAVLGDLIKNIREIERKKVNKLTTKSFNAHKSGKERFEEIENASGQN